MDRTTALAIFNALEEQRDTDYPGDPPTYDVRLDADSTRGVAEFDEATVRTWRVRVTPPHGSGGALTPDAVKFITEVVDGTGGLVLPGGAIEFLQLANNGIEVY